MIAILTLVYTQWTSMVVALRNASGRFGFFACGIDNLLSIPHPAAGRIVSSGTKNSVFRHN